LAKYDPVFEQSLGEDSGYDDEDGSVTPMPMII